MIGVGTCLFIGFYTYDGSSPFVCGIVFRFVCIFFCRPLPLRLPFVAASLYCICIVLSFLFLQINARQITSNSHTSKSKTEELRRAARERGGCVFRTTPPKTREAPHKHLNLPLNTNTNSAIGRHRNHEPSIELHINELQSHINIRINKY